MAKFLLVDDSRTSRRILRAILEEKGHEILAEAVNGEEGVEKYKELKPDIVTMDITMPILDGIDALKQIIAFDSSAIVVMVSAAGQKSKIVDAVKSGATEFIQKPFQPEQIISIVDKLAK